MGAQAKCPDCGAPLTLDAVRGLCPRCLLRAGLAGPDLCLTGAGPGATLDLGTSVIDTIARVVGPVPRVLLSDTAPGESTSPIVRDPSPADADPSLRYRIDGEIARGGMGAILKGRDPDLNRDIAVKVLRDDFRGDPAMVRRFVEEAQIGGQL